MNALWIPEGTDEAERNARIKSAIALLQGIKPSDEIEGMLASQMVATHSAAMECLRRSMIPEQTFAGREQSLKHASKLMLVYARQMDALNKHRGKGQQRVTVEHVHVEAGAQAVVGNIESGRSKQTPDEPTDNAAKSISFAPGKTLDMNVSQKVPVSTHDK
jgi:hypothetical protein